MAKKKKILFIIGGGISAYKSLELIRLLKTDNIDVVPVITKAAKQFVAPLTVSVLSKNKVLTKLLDVESEAEIGHIQLSRKADLILVAPLTANILAKMAHGLADDLASTILLATNKEILVAPAMNVKMWEHPATQRNISQIEADGVHILGPAKGDMACGEFGLGRMLEPVQIFNAVRAKFKDGALRGKRILITSGPTYEPLDPVRFIGNRSSGKQGKAIADSLILQGGDVVFISGPVYGPMPVGAEVFRIETADEMFNTVKGSGEFDVVICVAAVADWAAKNKQSQKLKKKLLENNLELRLVKTPDILEYVSKSENRPKLVIGFAAETEQIRSNSLKKLEEKGCDWIFANDVGYGTDIMGGDENNVTFFSREATKSFGRMQKNQVAKIITDMIIEEIG